MPAVRPVGENRVAIYIRWSTEDQGEGTTLAVQLHACRTFVAAQGWQVREDLTFVDEGVSGGTLDRPALGRLRQQVAEGRVDCVVVAKLDRLSRSVVDTVRLVLDEWEGRCHLRSALEPVDTVSPAGKLFFYQLMSFAEWERSAIRERTFAGKLRRALEGRNPGMPAAYGYRLGPGGMPMVEPGAAAVVRLIYRLCLSGMGCVQIARKLDELGHLSPGGKRWSSGQVARVLANPIYTGTLVYGRQVRVRGQKRRSDRPHLVLPGAVEPVVEQEMWAAVQAARGRRPAVGRRPAMGGAGGGTGPQSGGRAMASRSLLTGLLRCRCGSGCYGSLDAGGRHRYYACRARCGAARIRQADLDAAVTAALMARRAGAPAAAVLAALAAEREQAGHTAEGLDRELARVGDKEARVRALFLDGRLTAPEFQALRADLRRRAADLGRQMAAQREAAARADAALRRTEHALAALDHWGALTQAERKQVLRSFIDSVEACREPGAQAVACTITWRGEVPV